MIQDTEPGDCCDRNHPSIEQKIRLRLLPTGVNFNPRDAIPALQSNGKQHSCHLKEGSGGKTEMKGGEPHRHAGKGPGNQAPVPRGGQPQFLASGPEQHDDSVPLRFFVFSRNKGHVQKYLELKHEKDE